MYIDKYIKYKNKYNNLKNQLGGAYYRDLVKDENEEHIYIASRENRSNPFFRQTTFILKIASNIDSPLNNDIFSYLDNAIIPDINIIEFGKLHSFSAGVSNTVIGIYDNKFKIMKLNNYTILYYIPENMNLHNAAIKPLGDILINGYIINNRTSDVKKCRIIKNENFNGYTEVIIEVEINTVYFKIDNIDELDDIKPFNFEKFYDEEVKSLNICPSSSILLKNLTTSILNNIFITYTRTELEKVKTSIKSFDVYIKKLILDKLYTYRDNIMNTCRTKEEREMLLKNILKKLDTELSDMYIFNNNTNTFEQIKTHVNPSGRAYNITFDTGNASFTTIPYHLARLLGLSRIETLPNVMKGVVKDGSELLNEIVAIRIKLDNNPNHTIDDSEYNLYAYVTNNESNYILLGQSDKGLKQFFDKGYCITYNNNRTYYEQTNINILDSLGIASYNTDTCRQIITTLNTYLLNFDNDYQVAHDYTRYILNIRLIVARNLVYDLIHKDNLLNIKNLIIRLFKQIILDNGKKNTIDEQLTEKELSIKYIYNNLIGKKFAFSNSKIKQAFASGKGLFGI
jgi:hypothetical protein